MQTDVHGMSSDSYAIDRRRWLLRCVGGGFGAVVASIVGRSSSEASVVQGQSPPAGDRIRCVLTGTNAMGRSIIASDGFVRAADIWRTNQAQPLGPIAAEGATPVLPTTAPQIEPMPGGSRFFIASIAPSVEPKSTLENRRGFHRTATLDYIFVLTGEVSLLLDEQETHLKTGDCTILRNTLHSWRNDTDRPCQLLVAMIKVGA